MTAMMKATTAAMMTVAMTAAMNTTMTAAFTGAGAAEPDAEADARHRARAADVLDRLLDPDAVADSVRTERPRPTGAALLLSVVPRLRFVFAPGLALPRRHGMVDRYVECV
jgi:hypothetical protein